jgi:tRNA 5-methylaminomethyl-2-thiouridine biosynthesis bifunctional protein
MWRARQPQTGWLHFVSFEGYPLDAEDIAQALRPWPELSDLADRLCAAWPPRAHGVRQISWPEERITLHLHIGQIETTLPQAVFQADAWFLDGFSPAKNHAMWAETLWPLIAQRSAPNARVATFTVAGAVRRGLTEAGFRVEKCPGHGRKRERLEARFEAGAESRAPLQISCPRVAVIGAGIAGATLAHQLQSRGAKVTVFDQSDGPARGTSGNPLALVMPRLDAADTKQARLLIDAYILAQRFYLGRPGCARAETVQRSRDAAETARFEKLLSDPPLGLEQLEALRNGLLHKASIAIQPDHLLPALLTEIDVRWQTEAALNAAARRVNGECFDAIVLASGWQLGTVCPDLDVIGRLGQVEWIESTVESPASAIAAGAYAVASGRRRLWGATFAPHTGRGAEITEQARVENDTALHALAPYWQQDAARKTARSRAGVRATTVDHLPLIGALPDPAAMHSDRALLERAGWRTAPASYARPGLYVAGGFGSRGFTWAPYAASLLTAMIFESPLPAPDEALRAIAPNRQILRHLKRKTA